MVKTVLSRHFAAKQTPSQLHVACTRAFQIIFKTADQSGVGSYFGSCSALPFLHNSLQFFCQLSFCKIKMEEHSNLHNATLLRLFRFCWGKFKDFSRPYSGIQGLFKDFWQSRTFQGFTTKYKDFSRLCEPCILVILPTWAVFSLSLSPSLRRFCQNQHYLNEQ